MTPAQVKIVRLALAKTCHDGCEFTEETIAACQDPPCPCAKAARAVLEAIGPSIERSIILNHARGWEAGLKAAEQYFDRVGMKDAARKCYRMAMAEPPEEGQL